MPYSKGVGGIVDFTLVAFEFCSSIEEAVDEIVRQCVFVEKLVVAPKRVGEFLQSMGEPLSNFDDLVNAILRKKTQYPDCR